MKRLLFVMMFSVLIMGLFSENSVRAGSSSDEAIFSAIEMGSEEYNDIVSCINRSRDMLSFAGISETAGTENIILPEYIVLVQRMENDIALAYEKNRRVQDVITNDTWYLVPLNYDGKLFVLTIVVNGDELTLVDVWETVFDIDRADETPFCIDKAELNGNIAELGIKKEDLIDSRFLYSYSGHFILCYVNAKQGEFVIPYMFKSETLTLENGKAYSAPEFFEALKTELEGESEGDADKIYGGSVVPTYNNQDYSGKNYFVFAIIGTVLLIGTVAAVVFLKKKNAV